MNQQDTQWRPLTNKIIYKSIGCLQLQNVIQNKIKNFGINQIQRLFVISRLQDSKLLLGGCQRDAFMTFWLDEDKIILKIINKYFVRKVCLLEENFFLQQIGISHILGNQQLYITFFKQRLLKKQKQVKFQALPIYMQQNLLKQDSHKVYIQFFKDIDYGKYFLTILGNFEINKKLGLLLIRNFQINQFYIQVFIRNEEFQKKWDIDDIEYKLVYFVDQTNETNGFFMLGNKLNFVSLTKYKQKIIVLVNTGRCYVRECYEVYQYTNQHKLSKFIFKTKNKNYQIYKEHPFIVQNEIFLSSKLTNSQERITLKIEN